jgi:hypothetical protein
MKFTVVSFLVESRNVVRVTRVTKLYHFVTRSPLCCLRDPVEKDPKSSSQGRQEQKL